MVLVGLAAVCSIPFFRSSDFSWSEMNPFLQAMVLALTAALFCHAYFSRGSVRLRNTALLFVVSSFVSVVAEAAAIRWAWPFSSRYHYDPAIGPTLPGGVPLMIPLAWFMLAYTALVFLEPLSIRPGGSRSPGRVVLKAALCALFIMGADFALDPLGVMYDTWSWHEPGRYFGIPAGNFSGWFLVGFVICLTTLLLEKPCPEVPAKYRFALDRWFVLASIALTTLFFVGCTMRVGSVLPAALSLAFMGPCWVFWFASERRALR